MHRNVFFLVIEVMYLPNRTSTNPPALPSLQLEFAALCLRNAVLLLPDDPLDSETSSTDDSSDGK